MKQGFLQALGVAIYCTLVGLFMWNANHLFGPIDNFLGPVLIVTLFTTSALTCGLIVFFKPYKLFFAGKKKESIDIVVSTAGFLFGFVFLFLLLLLIFK